MSLEVLLSPLDGVESEFFVGVSIFSSFLFFFGTTLLFAGLGCIAFYFWLFFFNFRPSVIPKFGQFLVESYYSFVMDLVVGKLGYNGSIFFPLLFCVSGFLFFINILGMVPFGFTATAQVGFTFMLGFSLFVGLTIVGGLVHGFFFFKKFFVQYLSLDFKPFLP